MKTSEESNHILKQYYEETLSDCEESHKKITSLQNKLDTFKHKVTPKDEAVVIHRKDDTIKDLKNENVELVNNLELIEKNLKTQNKLVKSRDKEIYDLKKENVKISENLTEFKSKFANLTNIINREKKEEEKKQKKKERKDFMNNLKASSELQYFECNKCDVKSETFNQLKTHVRMVHEKTNSSQTDEINLEDQNIQTNQSEFTSNKCVGTLVEKDHGSDVTKEEIIEQLCFYCDKMITTKNQLIEHRVKCCGSTRLFCFAPLGLSASYGLSQSCKQAPFSFGHGF